MKSATPAGSLEDIEIVLLAAHRGRLNPIRLREARDLYDAQPERPPDFVTYVRRNFLDESPDADEPRSRPPIELHFREYSPARGSTDEPLLPAAYGPYQLLEKIGSDPFGILYTASRGTRTGLHVLLLPPSFGDDPGRVQALKEQAEKRIAMRHPRLIRTAMIGAHQGRYFCALRRIKGLRLSDLLYALKHLDESAGLLVGLQVAQALGYLHEFGTVHGAISPDAVWVADPRDVRVMPPAIPGLPREPEFQAPEKEETPASDAFALGALLKATVDRPGPELEALIERLCARDPNRRPDPMTAARSLESLARRKLGRRSVPRRRRPFLRLILAAGVLWLVGLAAGLFFPSSGANERSPEPPAPAAIKPPSPDAKELIRRGDAAFREGRFEEAKSLFERAGRAAPDIDVRSRLQDCATAIHIERARKEFEEILRLFNGRSNPAGLANRCRRFLDRYGDTPFAPTVRGFLNPPERPAEPPSERPPPEPFPPPTPAPLPEPAPVEEPTPLAPETPALREARTLFETGHLEAARKKLIPLLRGEDRAAAAALLSRILPAEARWNPVFDGKSLDQFHVVTLTDSSALLRDGQLYAEARGPDVVLLQLKSFDPKRATGIMLEFRIDAATQEDHSVALVFGWRGPKDYYELAAGLTVAWGRKRTPFRWLPLGRARPGPRTWHRLTACIEGEQTILLVDDRLVALAPSKEVAFTERVRVFVRGCRARIAGISIRE